MKREVIQIVNKFLALFLLTILFSGCSGIFDNPLKDKDTGEDIHLLVLDFNFFDTRIAVKLLDATTGEMIQAKASVNFSGINSNDVVTFAGKRKKDFITTQGQIEVAVDPNVSITESSPFQFSISVDADGYHRISKSFQLKSDGKKTVEIHLSGIQDEKELEIGGNLETGNGDTTFVFFARNDGDVKSATDDTPVHEVNYSITLNDFLKFKGAGGNVIFQSKQELLDAYNANPESFIVLSINKYTQFSPEIDMVNMDGGVVPALFHKLETGRFVGLKVSGNPVTDLNGGVITSQCTYSGDPAPDLFGFAEFVNSSWTILGADVVYTQLSFSYTVVEVSEEALCSTGSSITFRSNVVSSFSIDADIYDSNDNLLTTTNFKGNFPETFTVENTPNRAVKVVFRNNNPAFQPIAPLLISNFCSGSHEVNVLPAAGYQQYQIVLKAFCPDNATIAIAPTYSGEFKIKGSSSPWQGVDLVGGVVDLLGLPDQEYELRMLWENDWEYTSLATKFDSNGNYLHPYGSKVTSMRLPDGRIRINIEHTYSQSVCSDMGW